jgi:hypothetical protein
MDTQTTTLELLQMDETTVYTKDGYIVIEQRHPDHPPISVWIAPDRLQDVIRAMNDAEEILFPIVAGPVK